MRTCKISTGFFGLTRHGLAACGLALGITWGLTGTAAAHQLPVNRVLRFHPDDPSLIALHAKQGGLLLSTDGGDNFYFVCDAFTGVLNTEKPTLRYTSDGDLLLGNFDGLQKASSSGCGMEFPFATFSENYRVRDLIVDPEDFAASYAVTSAGGQENGVYHSTDDGETWTAIHMFPLNVFLQQIRVAESNTDIMYLAFSRLDTDTNVSTQWMARSTDAGETWSEQAAPLQGEESLFELLYVSDTDPDLLLAAARVDPMSQAAVDMDDRVLRSEDGGQTWDEVLTVGEVGGVTAHEGTVWIGDIQGEGLAGTKGGLWRSEDEGANFTNIDDEIKVGCLEYAHDKLWVCADNWFDRFSLAYSEDGGETLTTVLRDQDITGIAECSGDAAIIDACTMKWEDWQFDIERMLAFQDAGAGGGGAGTGAGGMGGAAGSAGDGTGSGTAGTSGSPVDAGTGDNGGGAGVGGEAQAMDDGGGCSCRVSGSDAAANGKGLGLLALGLIAALRGRRRKRA